MNNNLILPLQLLNEIFEYLDYESKLYMKHLNRNTFYNLKIFKIGDIYLLDNMTYKYNYSFVRLNKITKKTLLFQNMTSKVKKKYNNYKFHNFTKTIIPKDNTLEIFRCHKKGISIDNKKIYIGYKNFLITSYEGEDIINYWYES